MHKNVFITSVYVLHSLILFGTFCVSLKTILRWRKLSFISLTQD